MEYISDVVQKAAGIAQGPWTPSPVPGSVIFSVIRAIVFSIYAITTFKITAYTSADALDSISFLRVKFNSSVSIDVSCFTIDALVCPVEVETTRDSSPGGYT